VLRTKAKVWLSAEIVSTPPASTTFWDEILLCRNFRRFGSPLRASSHSGRCCCLHIKLNCLQLGHSYTVGYQPQQIAIVNAMHGKVVEMRFLISGYFKPLFLSLKNDAKKNRYIEKMKNRAIMNYYMLTSFMSLKRRNNMKA